MTASAINLLRYARRHDAAEADRDAGAELAVNLAHDLRSPLSSILVLAQAMRAGSAGPVNETQRHQLGLIYDAAMRLCSTTNDVMEIARGERQLLEQEPEPFDAAELLRSVRDMVAPMAEEKGLKLVVTPPVIARRLGHARALSRVLLNLATNAIKFTERGFVEIAAREVDGDRVLEFSVADTGCGFDRSLSGRAGPVIGCIGAGRKLRTGTGLGLRVCRTLVDAMGGEMAVESQSGRGTRVHFRLEVSPLDPAR